MIYEGGQSSLNYLLHVAGRIQQVLRVRMLGCVACCCSYSVTGSATCTSSNSRHVSHASGGTGAKRYRYIKVYSLRGLLL